MVGNVLGRVISYAYTIDATSSLKSLWHRKRRWGLEEKWWCSTTKVRLNIINVAEGDKENNGMTLSHPKKQGSTSGHCWSAPAPHHEWRFHCKGRNMENIVSYNYFFTEKSMNTNSKNVNMFVLLLLFKIWCCACRMMEVMCYFILEKTIYIIYDFHKTNRFLISGRSAGKPLQATVKITGAKVSVSQCLIKSERRACLCQLINMSGKLLETCNSRTNQLQHVSRNNC